MWTWYHFELLESLASSPGPRHFCSLGFLRCTQLLSRALLLGSQFHLPSADLSSAEFSPFAQLQSSLRQHRKEACACKCIPGGATCLDNRWLLTFIWLAGGLGAGFKTGQMGVGSWRKWQASRVGRGGPGQGRAPLSQEPLCTLPAALKPLPLSPNQAQAHSNQ